jgi:hypothetical protein
MLKFFIGQTMIFETIGWSLVYIRLNAVIEQRCHYSIFFDYLEKRFICSVTDWGRDIMLGIYSRYTRHIFSFYIWVVYVIVFFLFCMFMHVSNCDFTVGVFLLYRLFLVGLFPLSLLPFWDFPGWENSFSLSPYIEFSEFKCVCLYVKLKSAVICTLVYGDINKNYI